MTTDDVLGKLGSKGKNELAKQINADRNTDEQKPQVETETQANKDN